MNKKTHVHLMVAVIVFVVTLTAFFYTLYQVHQQGIRFAEARKMINEHAAKEASYNNVQTLLANTKIERDKIKSFFLAEKDTITFISDMETTAQTLGVTLVTNQLAIIPAATDTNGVATPAVLSVGFSLSGTKAATSQFVTLLENIPYHKKLTQLAFLKSSDETWKADVSMQLTLQYD